ncbi:homeobox protein Hox-D13a [Danio rerio]|uniref:Homeobox protein Hox-D13a n=2 Tax=Danio rerio TaxID=7955 RepID=HXDDA_DANRE|nr:homeobox protein Hox-D13a [Danio rerio]Q90472.2 RecName: Full=Homeobox protein Hox-D13a; Short=Hox-D13 [Danio rerio]AAH91996.1 Homeo box D13a [Danio rerio]AAI63878.1 Homeo box D13a [Danio rerio]AAI65451.1 Hoxd13a protein [Danio rerio]|eukprot:NP_571244.2 homeobox protein Hox-D13 [Danio rerio]
MDGGGLDEEFINVYPSAFGTHSSRCTSGAPVLSAVDRPTSVCNESISPYFSFPSNIGSGSFTFGCHLENSYKVPQNAVFPPGVAKQNGQFANKPVDHGEASSWLKEFAFYQGCARSYPRIPAFIDLPVVQRAMMGDLRHETCLTMEGHQHWDWSNNCSSQLYCFQDQTRSPHIWKPSLTEEAAAASFCQRGRKKRVPYTKFQLKELEREYNTTKFITKENRRRIASSTNLSERQVTIWFQNRRVKDKKRPDVCIKC